MSILLCSATRFEIEPTISFLKELEPVTVDVLITGVGQVATTYSLTRAIYSKRPAYLIQAGVAGTFDPAARLGTVVAVQSDSLGDLGVEENGNFRSVFDMKLSEENSFPWESGRLQNRSVLIEQLDLPRVVSVTVNEISTNPRRIDHYRQVMGASVESMEGAAFHYVALMEKIPFVQLRSLSNFVGERNKEQWRMAESIRSLNETLKTLIVKLNQ